MHFRRLSYVTPILPSAIIWIKIRYFDEWEMFLVFFLPKFDWTFEVLNYFQFVYSLFVTKLFRTVIHSLKYYSIVGCWYFGNKTCLHFSSIFSSQKIICTLLFRLQYLIYGKIYLFITSEENIFQTDSKKKQHPISEYITESIFRHDIFLNRNELKM